MSDSPFNLDRRGFVKLSLVGSAGAAVACHSGSDKAIPLLVPDEPVPPGVAFWSRGICRQCDSGCGVLVKRMDAEVPVEVGGEHYRQHRLVAKKLEGNPDHPLSRGALCARGQAAIEATYHPERLRGPLLAASRGSGNFQSITWEQAIRTAADRLNAARHGGVLWLGSPVRGTASELISAVLSDLGCRQLQYRPFASPLAEQSPDALVAELLPQADYVLSFGNFLETWPAQVSATRAYSEFRRNGSRGFFTQVEPRLSLTAVNADRWIAIKPGSEGVFALGVAARLPGANGLEGYSAARVSEACGVPADFVAQVADEIRRSHSPFIVGGPNSYAYSNGKFQAEAVALLRAHAGGPLAHGGSVIAAGVQELVPPLPTPPRVLIIHESNPLFSAPPHWGVAQWLRGAAYVIVLGMFADETALQSDLLLPLSTNLESWSDDEQRGVNGSTMYALNEPAMKPLYDTRSVIEVVLDLGKAVGAKAGALQFADAESAVRERWRALLVAPQSTQSFDQSWKAAVERGGYFPPVQPSATSPARSTTAEQSGAISEASVAEFAGDAQEYPYFLRFYESPVFGDGRWAHLSWLQELPDPTTSAMWSNWVELHPQTAAKLGVETGDGVWVESTAGRIELPAFVFPGIRADTVAIPAGQGHSSDKEPMARHGANGYTLLAAITETTTGALAWQSTRVRLARSGRKLALPLFGRSFRTDVTEQR